MPLRNLKRAAKGTPSPHGPHKRAKTAKGSASQPILMDDSQSKLSIRTSPRKALAAAASQATEDAPFESQLRDAIPEATIQPPAEGSRAATEATSEAIEGGDDTGFDDEFTDNFDGIN
ncbi:hypothetical protein PTTW11_03054 [Pyrenophora teres f. teres]|uniref:Uncharacterized protein n=1 Tax=Pyrenophora teres f. teres TaxID=97479 RepID=A0A6S6VX21_9PLEO|nr:hypothetical protein PTTW11_03054 [Pyrenophora teres f. teres]